ncbi:reverse transcriptase domain-containing protein [Tanacetum coccineum]
MDERSRRSLLKNERMPRVITNDGHTNKGRKSNNVPHNLRRNHERSTNGRKGKETNPRILCLMVYSPEGKEYTYALRFAFETTNNEAEYVAFLAGLHIAKEMEIRELIIFVDSQLVANQGTLLDDPQKARKLRIKAPLYKMIKEKLYRRSYLSPWLRCVGPMQAKNIIKEVHEGSCRRNSGPSASKAEYQGKLGPTWEGPYVIRKAYGDGAYKLEMLSGEAVDRTWNRTNLRKFYV